MDFDAKTVKAVRIKEDAEYEGVRVTFTPPLSSVANRHLAGPAGLLRSAQSSPILLGFVRGEREGHSTRLFEPPESCSNIERAVRSNLLVAHLVGEAFHEPPRRRRK